MDELSSTPKSRINVLGPQDGEVLKLGPTTMRILEDGSRSDRRFGFVEVTIPPRTAGPPPHWHEMHDESFFVTKGTVRFMVPLDAGDADTDGLGLKHVDIKPGQFVMAPTFLNPFDEEAVLYGSVTPAFYIDYFRILARAQQQSGLTPEVQKEAMLRFATINMPGEKEYKSMQRI